MSACCAPVPPSHEADGGEVQPHPFTPASADPFAGGMVAIVGGAFRMGTDDPHAYGEDGEGPVRSVEVPTFSMDATAITNAQFGAFVSATGYVTEAEREGWAFVFGGLLPDDFPDTRGVAAAPWWRQVFGADWAHPHGPQSDVDELQLWQHPVVQVSWNDAVAFSAWRGVRLPSEVEWECAARGGLDQCHYPWGHELTPGGQHRSNVWQGRFPTDNSCDDGWYGTAPADTFEPNAFGLFNMTGNAWEWTGDRFDAVTPSMTIRGGSFLCHESYCWRYRTSARSGNTPDAATGNLGFRCVS